MFPRFANINSSQLIYSTLLEALISKTQPLHFSLCVSKNNESEMEANSAFVGVLCQVLSKTIKIDVSYVYFQQHPAASSGPEEPVLTFL